MPQNTKKDAKEKPAKPYPDFPLFPHAAGVWAKKIRGKLYYFGPWADADAAMKRYLDERDDLYAGRTPRPKSDALTIRELANRFLTAKEHLRDTGEITSRTWTDYFACCERLIRIWGVDRGVADLIPDDFAHLRKNLTLALGPVALGNEIQRVRSLLKFAYESGLIDVPIRYGQAFNRPSKCVLRKQRATKGLMMFEAADIRRLLGAVEQPLEAMILLGINAGLGNSDIGNLPTKAINLKTNWLNYPRTKTGIQRRIPLWPETIASIREVIASRAKPKDHKHRGLLFITKYGSPWYKNTSDNPISKKFRKLLDELNLHRKGLGFYSLRHSFETVAGGSKDQVAVDFLMGHAREDMASVYREKVDDDRLLAVVNHVHAWLFPKEKKSEG